VTVVGVFVRVFVRRHPGCDGEELVNSQPTFSNQPPYFRFEIRASLNYTRDNIGSRIVRALR
jgi:hypothetical protein